MHFGVDVSEHTTTEGTKLLLPSRLKLLIRSAHALDYNWMIVIVSDSY